MALPRATTATRLEVRPQQLGKSGGVDGDLTGEGKAGPAPTTMTSASAS
jgi:hypothetical protein